MRGILLMLSAFVTFSCMDTTAKLLGGLGYDAVFIIWARLLIQLAVLAPFVLQRGGVRAVASHHPWLQIVRGFAMLGAGVSFVTGLHFLPLATMTAINFIGPFVVTIMSIIFLPEHVGPPRGVAIVVGFAGALLIIRPGTDGFHPASLFAVGTAFCWSVAMITTRQIQPDDSTLTTLVWTVVAGLAGSSLLVPLFWKPLTWEALGLLTVMGVGATLGQLFMVKALNHAGASMLAPFAYSQIIWATLLGFIFWGEFPDQLTWLGAAIIVVAGLYVWYRERRLATPRLKRPA
jgi:drug/metabolite transporter (DMT)-like permease